MKNDSTVLPKTERIDGPAHKPDYGHPASKEDLNKPKEKAEESEVAGRHKNSGQKDHKGAR